HADHAALPEDVHAETTQTLHIVGEVGAAGGLEAGEYVLGHDVARHALGVLRLEGGCFGGNELPAHTKDGRVPGLHVQVGAAAIYDELQVLIECGQGLSRSSLLGSDHRLPPLADLKAVIRAYAVA